MKKNLISIIVLIMIVVLFFLFKPTKKFFPLLPPNINVTCNRNKIETAKGDYNWFNGKTGGNSSMADTSTNLVKKLKDITLQQGEDIKFSFSDLWKQPNETAVYLVMSDNSTIKQVENINSFSVPKEKGEYMYLISGKWDETHSMSYVFKVNVE